MFNYYWLWIDICLCQIHRSTQNNHVKVSLPAKLQRIRYYGGLKLEDFKDLLTSTEFKICAKVRQSRSAWFLLTIDVFISFLYRVCFLNLYLGLWCYWGVCILLRTKFEWQFDKNYYMSLKWNCLLQQDLSRAADESAIKFKRSTPAEERTAEGVWKVMNAAEASMVKSIKNKDFQKYLSVGNPKHGEGFFDEVFLFLSIFPSFQYLLWQFINSFKKTLHLTHWDFFPNRSTIISVISKQLKWQSRGCKRLQPLPLTHVSKQGGFITGILQLLFDLPTGFQVRVSKTVHLTYSSIEHHFGPRWFIFPILVFL